MFTEVDDQSESFTDGDLFGGEPSTTITPQADLSLLDTLREG
jgi:hypothetical protein